MKYRRLKNYKYQLMEDTTFKLKLGFQFGSQESLVQTPFICLTYIGNLTLSKGYSWDGATCFPDHDWIKTPSLVHDALCQLISDGLLDRKYKKVADKILREMCKARIGRWKFRANLIYFGVRKFGRFFKSKTGQDKILTVQ